MTLEEKIKLRLTELGFIDKVEFIDTIVAEQFLFAINQPNVNTVTHDNGKFVIEYKE